MKQTDAARAIEAQGFAVAPVRLVSRVAYARSLMAGQVAQEFRPNGKAAKEAAAPAHLRVYTPVYFSKGDANRWPESQASKRRLARGSPMMEEPEGPKRSRGGTSTRRPSRTGTRHIGGHFPPEVAKQLRQLAVDEDTSHQKLLGEALDLLFQSRRLPTIASK